ncbi:uncharacterized protein V3H82_003375 [Fundulus diaphanus]
MSKRRAHVNCSVVGCTNKHANVFSLTASVDQTTRQQWIKFIFDNNVPVTLPATLYVCASHFAPECFVNLGQYQAKMASSLRLEKGVIPTIRDSSAAHTARTFQAVPSSILTPQRVDVGCQTKPQMHASAGTQLSYRTLGPHFRSVGTQTTEAKTTKDVGVYTSTIAVFPDVPWSFMPAKPPLKRPRLSLAEDGDGASSVDATCSLAGPEDSTYNPEDSVNVLTESVGSLKDPSSPHGEPVSVRKIRKLIVFESCLMELFEKCPVCGRVCEIQKSIRGTFCAIVQKCPHCQHGRLWKSQPVIGHSTPAGNLQLSAAVCLSGASFFSVQKVFKAMQLQIHSYKQFRKHCCNFIEPAVLHKWKSDQTAILQQLSQEGRAILGGDMRTDSPGPGAKYGSYSMMDLKRNNVVDIQLVQSNEVGGSTNMEREALKRSLTLLEESGIKLECIVSDRRPQIQKFLADAKITQYHDVWRFEKGISKKLKAISKTKECEKVKKWLPMIKNQIYWIAASSSSGKERVAKWLSVINHVQDIHTHDYPFYPKCTHLPRVSKGKEKWLKGGTTVLYKLQKLFTGKRVLKDVSKLSPHHQAPSLEAFRSAVTRFVPKRVPLPSLGTLCRLCLAAMHYNENAERPQRQGNGKVSFKLCWPKGRQGTCTVKPLKEKSTFKYVDELMQLVFDVVFLDPAPFVSQLKQIPVPEPLCSPYDRPEKEDAISRHGSRFS